MSFIDTIDPADATADVRAMYARQQDAWGYVPNYAKAFSHRPELMARWGRLLAELKRPMDHRRFELVTFAAAHELRHSACSLAHGRQLTAHFTRDEICALAAGEPVASLSEAEAAIVGFARQVARDAASVTGADVARLRELGLGSDEIFDVAAVAAGRAFFTKILDAVGSLPDAAFAGLDTQIRDALTVGRPIDTADVVVMEAENAA